MYHCKCGKINSGNSYIPVGIDVPNCCNYLYFYYKDSYYEIYVKRNNDVYFITSHGEISIATELGRIIIAEYNELGDISEAKKIIDKYLDNLIFE